MTMFKVFSKGLVLLLLLGLSVGCATKKPKAGAHALAEKSAGGPTRTNDEGLGGDRQEIEVVDLMDLPGAREAGLCPMIHFDYDKSDIKSEWTECLNNIAAYFSQHPEYDLLIEGHCDERGTNEYNMALGEHRAESTAGYLNERGMTAGRIQLKSLGEERPIATCANESCWSQNRRAQFYGIIKGSGR